VSTPEPPSAPDFEDLRGLARGLRLLVEIGATIVHPPEEASFAPGYYSVLFEDPDGIRLEMNHVPGKGWLSEPSKS